MAALNNRIITKYRKIILILILIVIVSRNPDFLLTGRVGYNGPSLIGERGRHVTLDSRFHS